MIEYWQFKQRQSIPLEGKILFSRKRIEEWYRHWDGNVYVSFSGGKDSTVLLHLVRSLYPEVPAVFVDTGLEYPEIRDFVKTIPNVTWLRPKIPFPEVISKYGYPVVSKENSQKISEIRTSKSQKLIDKRLYGPSGKLPQRWRFLTEAPFKISHKCCNVLKKAPVKAYETVTKRAPFVGTLAGESRLRLTSYLRNGCNSFQGRPMSTPLAIWTDTDVWGYLKQENLPYSKIYDMGYDRTGCMFCLFGAHLDTDTRFETMSVTHPNQYRYCMEILGVRQVLEYLKKNK